MHKNNIYLYSNCTQKDDTIQFKLTLFQAVENCSILFMSQCENTVSNLMLPLQVENIILAN